MVNKKLHDLKFGIEVSTRYHEWRRSYLEGWLIFVRIVSAVGAILSLIGLSIGPSVKILQVDGSYVIAIGATAVAIVNILDFALRGDVLAIKHADLYRRFKELQANISRKQKPSDKQISEWESDAQFLRADEPPTLWALYITSWNQAVERQDPVYKVGLRRISWFQLKTKNLVHYLPRDFPPTQSQERTR